MPLPMLQIISVMDVYGRQVSGRFSPGWMIFQPSLTGWHLTSGTLWKPDHSWKNLALLSDLQFHIMKFVHTMNSCQKIKNSSFSAMQEPGHLRFRVSWIVSVFQILKSSVVVLIWSGELGWTGIPSEPFLPAGEVLFSPAFLFLSFFSPARQSSLFYAIVN